ncbi:astacin [Dictyocaulus viviparus]|uniref:Metalloendopeptidase n=1 Tax=Dictyocaulus viviparus TaxID=29172 RepID=A0A0D8Y885_DICVI|nr:astacin [Dictyocaulus viviparus]
MDAIAENTCIQFNPRKNEKDYVNIRNQVGEGCFSSIGMEGGEQSLDLEASFLGSCMSYNIIIHELLHTVGLDHEHSRHDRDNYVKVHLENFSCMSYNIIIHELLHTVGLDHEHSRHDRDNYVKVHLENVREGRKSQFKKVSFIPDYDIPYDYTSIMHYDKLAFSRNGNITLETLDSSYQDIIGTAKHPSPNDYLKVCAMYHCGICMGKKTNTEIFTPSLSSLPELSLPLPVYGTQSDRIEAQN